MKANPRVIGLFITAAGALLVVFTLYFGSAKLSSSATRYILLFDQSINGLQVGSSVKFRGVPIGAVERILLQAEGQAEDSISIPVIITIDHEKLHRDYYEVMRPESEWRTTEEMLEKGMVAKLALESFITGQLFIEMTVETDGMRSEKSIRRLGEYLEIPTVGTSLDEITADMARLIEKTANLDLESLSDTIEDLLVATTEAVEGLDTEGLSTSLVGATDQLTALMESGDIQALLETAEATLASYNLETGVAAEEIKLIRERISATLEEVEIAAASYGEMVAPGSSFRYEMEKSLRELRGAAKAMRELAVFLESNPNALLTGRAE